MFARLSLPRLLLHLEGLFVFAAAIAAFAHLGGNGWLFAALLLVPDLSALGYFVNKEVGSVMYNAAHTYTGPGVLLAVGLAMQQPLVVLIALIWLAHIGMDRTVGYGLKYPSAFKDTHLQRV
ncbi:MAG: DUF4260 domain-containing protein [Chloroflexota bacterium]|nr:DUF4260 domain-containing protein [Chloroflexota bacterium]